MQNWKKELHCKGKGQPSIDQVGQGEGGGPRWWAGKWDERKSEQVMQNGLKISLSSSSSHDCSLESAKAQMDSDSDLTLPRIHVAWDGMIVQFERE